MGPNLTAELSHFHQRDLLCAAEHERLAAEATAHPTAHCHVPSQPACMPPPVSQAMRSLPGAASKAVAVSGQAEWLEELLQRYSHRLNTFAYGLLGCPQQAEDIVQEVFVAAWRAAQQRKAPFGDTLDEAGAHRWLFRVAYRRAISLRRHSSVLLWQSLDALEDSEKAIALATARGASPTSFEDRVVERESLSAALGHLSLTDAACVLLYFAQDCTVLELAGSLKISPVAAKQRIKRARARLRSAYFAHDDASPLVHGSAHVCGS